VKPIKGEDDARLNHCREFNRQQDDSDFIETLEFRDQLTIGFWGSIEKYKEWKANKEGRSKSASMSGDQL
jgi:hypothetical protein